jgi:translation initiation factor RLI1
MLKKGINTVYGVSLKLENFFDSYDFYYLNTLLRQETNAVGVISEYACPVIVKIYFPSEIEDKEGLISILESEELTYSIKDNETTVELNYEVADKPEYFTISRKEYVSLLFTPYEKTFNHKNNYSNEVVATWQIPLGKNNKLRKRFSYLVSHLSNDDGVVEFKTLLDTNYNEVAKISYIDTITTIENIKAALLSDTLTISYSNGQKKRVPNMFDFSEIINNSIKQE